ncbi:MAG: hypothetical protein GC205_05685 [Bacteroidetes bacterium]|nr:hypothetical protein [Bacteroidota bacterium]
MKKLMLVTVAAIFLGLTACSISTPAIDTNVAGDVAGLYRGMLVTDDGEVFLDEEIEMHRVSDDRVGIESTVPVDNQTAGRFSTFEMQLMRSGAVIHHQLGSEANGTFVLDAAVTPDELRIELPNGLKFSGIRIKNYFE